MTTTAPVASAGMTDELHVSVAAQAPSGSAAGRRGRRSKIALAGLLALCVAVLAACGGSGASEADLETGNWGSVINPDGEPERGGTLRVATEQEPPGISPLYFSLEVPDAATIKVIMQMFDQLVELRPGSLEPQPGLAKSWEVSEDGLTYTFQLRDAQFSNGMRVTPSDVKYTLDRLRSDESFFVDLFQSISAVETPKDSTVVLRLSEPVPALLDYLTFPGASIVPATVVKEDGVDAFNDHPIGSGPFKLEEWQRDQQVVLSQNDKYWREGLPHLDEVRLITTPDDNARVLDIESGTVNVSDVIPFGQIDRVNGSGGANVLVSPGAETHGIMVNNSKPPYDEVAVRRALNYATPAEEIVDVVFHGDAERANSELPKLKYWTDDAAPFPYDLEKARDELADSSVPDGFVARMIIDPNAQAPRQISQIVQQSWAEIGIDLQIEQPDAATTEESFLNGTFEMILGAPGGGSSDVAVEDQFAKLLFDSPETNNLYTFSGRTEATQLTREAVREPDEERRAELFGEVHKFTMREPQSVPLVFTPNRVAVADDVHNFNYMLLGWFLLDEVWLQQ